jgi:hypothetical protein
MQLCGPAEKVKRFAQTLGMALAPSGMDSQRSGLLNEGEFQSKFHPPNYLPELLGILAPDLRVGVDGPNRDMYHLSLGYPGHNTFGFIRGERKRHTGDCHAIPQSCRCMA